MRESDAWQSIFMATPAIGGLTETAVGAALEGFVLQPGQGMAWLARAIQGALYCSIQDESNGPDRQSNAVTKRELTRLSNDARKLWLQLFSQSRRADEALSDFAWQRWKKQAGEQDALFAGVQSDFAAVRETCDKIEWLATYLHSAAQALPSQKHKWKVSELRELRIVRAHYLSPVFELAFGKDATVNTWPGSNGGHWRDFYQRIVALAFGEQVTPDWEYVLDTARRRHLRDRVIFGDGLIPDSPP